jgi:hypothetical protein
MAPTISTSTEAPSREAHLVNRLTGLYREEIQVYGQILSLSRDQGNLISNGRPLTEIRGILERKKKCLDIIARLEATEKGAKQEWEQGKAGWSAAARTQLHDVLFQVGNLIEEILTCEEANDQKLIEQARAGV